jgi:hypothetical protein
MYEGNVEEDLFILFEDAELKNKTLGFGIVTTL